MKKIFLRDILATVKKLWIQPLIHGTFPIHVVMYAANSLCQNVATNVLYCVIQVLVHPVPKWYETTAIVVTQLQPRGVALKRIGRAENHAAKS